MSEFHLGEASRAAAELLAADALRELGVPAPGRAAYDSHYSYGCYCFLSSSLSV